MNCTKSEILTLLLTFRKQPEINSTNIFRIIIFSFPISLHIHVDIFQFSSVQFSLSRVRLFATPWIAAPQASLSITNSWIYLVVHKSLHHDPEDEYISQKFSYNWEKLSLKYILFCTFIEWFKILYLYPLGILFLKM